VTSVDAGAVQVPQYAGIVTRAVAFVVDLLILNGALFVIALGVGLVIEAFGKFSPDFDPQGIAAAGVVWSLSFAIYFTTCWSLTGQTPGMRALGIKVLPSKGGRLPPRRAFVRVLGMLAAAIPLFAGYLLILVTERRRGLQDLLARTVVVYVEQQRPPVPYHRA
jgi:uncharacterized RDD family membrane protein YckC